MQCQTYSKYKARHAVLSHQSSFPVAIITPLGGSIPRLTGSKHVSYIIPLKVSLPELNLCSRSKDVTGNPKATRGIFLVYDVFGLFIQTLRGADILASGYDPIPDSIGDFQVFMPDFFGDNPQDIANFPPKTPKQYDAIMKFMHGPAHPPNSVKLVKPLMEAIIKDHPEIKSWATLGMCWGGKVSTLISGEGTIFKASAQFHPSLLDVEDATKVTIPHCVLPSMDEDVDVSHST